MYKGGRERFDHRDLKGKRYPSPSAEELIVKKW